MASASRQRAMFLLATNLWTRHDGTLSTRRIRQASLSSISSLCCSDRLAHGLRHGLPTTTIGRWSTTPCLATAICIVSTLLFVYLEKTRRSPYFMLKAFKSRSIQGGILLFIGLMICNSSSMLVNIFVGVGMKTDQIQVAALGNWVLLGYFIGLVTILILKGKVQVQATLSAIKEMSGWTIYACLIRRTDACGAVA